MVRLVVVVVAVLLPVLLELQRVELVLLGREIMVVVTVVLPELTFLAAAVVEPEL
jgi:hypothetical protein